MLSACPRPRTSELTFLLQKTPTEQFLLKRVSYARLPNAFFAGVRKAAESAVDVGEDFPRQARAMYRGALPQRLIKGMCTRKEARELVEEGIGVVPLPESAGKTLN